MVGATQPRPPAASPVRPPSARSANLFRPPAGPAGNTEQTTHTALATGWIRPLAGRIRLMANCPEARRVRRQLDQQLLDAGRAAGMTLQWSAQEAEILDLIRDQINRKTDLQRDYSRAESVTARVHASSEIRLLENSIERLLRRIKTDVPAGPESIATIRARTAATKRWDAARASGEIA